MNFICCLFCLILMPQIHGVLLFWLSKGVRHGELEALLRKDSTIMKKLSIKNASLLILKDYAHRADTNDSQAVAKLQGENMIYVAAIEDIVFEVDATSEVNAVAHVKGFTVRFFIEGGKTENEANEAAYKLEADKAWVHQCPIGEKKYQETNAEDSRYKSLLEALGLKPTLKL